MLPSFWGLALVFREAKMLKRRESCSSQMCQQVALHFLSLIKENFNVNSDVLLSGRHASSSGFSFLVWV